MHMRTVNIIYFTSQCSTVVKCHQSITSICYLYSNKAISVENCVKKVPHTICDVLCTNLPLINFVP